MRLTKTIWRVSFDQRFRLHTLYARTVDFRPYDGQVEIGLGFLGGTLGLGAKTPKFAVQPILNFLGQELCALSRLSKLYKTDY
jgi:hypothetical protein